MADKSGAWFLELILNVLLLAGVAWVTFASRSEQERGLAVPLFAAVSPVAQSSTSKLPPNAMTPAAPAADASNPAKPATVANPGTTTNPLTSATSAVGPSFQQAWGSLQLWAARLDGKISPEELQKIQDSLASGWNSTQSARDYLKSVNERINAGQTDQVISEALKTLSQQANEKKVQVMNSVVQFMRDNGITWDQTKALLSKWFTEVLKLSPMDLLNSLKF